MPKPTFRGANKRKADESFGKTQAAVSLNEWLHLFGGRSYPTPAHFANVDAIWISGPPYNNVFFLEFVSRRIAHDAYDEVMFDAPQYDKITELQKITGFSTILLISYTDRIGYLHLPTPNARRGEGDEKKFVYFDLSLFEWLETPVRFEAPIYALPDESAN